MSPADPDRIEAVQERLGREIPACVRSFWQHCDGAKLDSADADLLGANDVLELLTERHIEEGQLPLLYDRGSNYVTAFLSKPLAPRVLYVSHDDSPKLLYRDAGSFYAGISDLLESCSTATDFFRETYGDYKPGGPRTSADRDAASSLLESKDCPVSLALQLDTTDIYKLTQLLNSDDYFTYQAVFQQMSKMDDPVIRAVLERRKNGYNQFLAQISTAATEAGIPHILEDGMLRVAGEPVQIGHWSPNVASELPRILEAMQALEDAHGPEYRKRIATEASDKAAELFKARDYAAVVALLEPLESELDAVTQKKLAFARKKARP
jgi:hypothetical protein